MVFRGVIVALYLILLCSVFGNFVEVKVGVVEGQPKFERLNAYLEAMKTEKSLWLFEDFKS